MRLTDQQLIPAPREPVWEGLNDPHILKQCIPGCESIKKVDDTTFEARVVAKVGPVKATFRGRVSLTNLKPPESYVIVGQGEGGIAGFAKGRAEVGLEEKGPAETLLSYDVEAQIGGKLAMIGSRLIDSTARSMAQKFFQKFVKLMSKPAVAPAKPVKKPAKKAPGKSLKPQAKAGRGAIRRR